jgi:hypothetical protein
MTRAAAFLTVPALFSVAPKIHEDYDFLYIFSKILF